MTPVTRPVDELLPVRWPGGRVQLAVRFLPAGDDLLVCLHGFGCAKECFDSAFAAGRLAGLSVMAFDFPGHGRSGPLPETTDPVQALAELTGHLIRRAARHRVFLVCHGMGCAVGLLASGDLPRLDGFISVEGNLVSQDCAMVSRRAAQVPRPEFVRWEHPKFQARLIASPRPDLRAWGRWYAQADPAALHRLAPALVDWSASGKLLALLTSLDAAAYLYGEDRQEDLGYLLSALDGVPAYPVAGAGHFPMLDNPVDFWRTVAGSLSHW